MTSPFALIFLRLPGVAMISALVLFSNVLSTFWYQYQVQYHYSLVAVPALAIGTVYALGAVKSKLTVQSLEVPLRAVGIAVLALSSFMTAFMWSPMPWGRTVLFHGDPDNMYAVSMREIIEEIPARASVAAHHRVTPHIAYRPEIYQFPNPFRLVLYGPDPELEGIRLSERAERVDFVVLPTSEDENVADDFAIIKAAFVEVAANQFWVLYERDRSVPLPGN